MPNENDEPTLDQLPDDAPIDQVRAALKRQQKRNQELADQASDAAVARKELAFLRAGVDDSALGKLFMRGYEGELDPEAIKTAWTEVAPSTPPPPAETPPPEQGGLSVEEQERLRRTEEALNSNTTPPGGEPNKPLGIDIMDAAFEKQGGARARPNAGMSDASMNAGFSRLFARAVEDDAEAVFKRPNETWADATDRWRASKS